MKNTEDMEAKSNCPCGHSKIMHGKLGCGGLLFYDKDQWLAVIPGYRESTGTDTNYSGPGFDGEIRSCPCEKEMK